MKIFWWIYFLCIGLFLSIPIQLVAYAIFSIATRGSLACEYVDTWTACGIGEFIVTGTFWLVIFNLVTYGVPTLIATVFVAILGMFFMRKSKLLQPMKPV
ncbi:MAG: hypothetical protein AAB892_00405 [Patescibacteria group bacterium]